MTETAHQNHEQRYAEKAEQMRAEISRLRAEIDRLSERDRPPRVESPPAAPEPEDSAVAKATGQPKILGAANTADQTTYLTSTDPGGGLYAFGTAGRAVTGVGYAGAGLYGYSYDGDAVVGQAHTQNGAGVRGQGAGTGVHGESTGSGVGVYGRSTSGPGTYGYSDDGLGAVGVSLNAIGSLAFSREREALNAYSVNGDGVRAGTASGNAAAVFAENASGSASGVAVVGLGQSGVGVYASGTHAPMQLGRAQTAGPPVADFHVAGEIMLDANADLYLCKATGTPGTWKLIG